MTACNSLRQTLLQRRPAQLCLPQEALRSGGESIAVFLAAQLDYRTRPCNFVEIMPRLDEHLRRPKAKGASA